MTNQERRAQGVPRGATAEFFRPRFDQSQIAMELTITILKNGQTKVTGPLNNRALCEAILQDAYNMIKEYSPKSEEEEHKPDAGIVVETPRIILPG